MTIATEVTPRDPILNDIPMPIVTPRLTLRPTMPGDGAETHEAVAETFDQLHVWMPWAQKLETIDQIEINIRKAYAEFILRTNMRLIGRETDTGRPVIFCGLHRFDWAARRFEIGYWVRASAQGKGYATETANALTRFAFGAIGAQRVEITHGGGNDRSRNVIEKLGFKHEGTNEKDHVVGDRLVDTLKYARFDTKGLPPLDVRWGPT